MPIKIIDLEEGMPKVEEARLRMQHQLQVARKQGYAAVKLIHGYGSGGVRSFIAGEHWRVSDEATWALLKRYPEWKQDSDLGKGNKGISIVLL
jgi:hypothetical protein